MSPASTSSCFLMTMLCIQTAMLAYIVPLASKGFGHLRAHLRQDFVMHVRFDLWLNLRSQSLVDDTASVQSTLELLVNCLQKWLRSCRKQSDVCRSVAQALQLGIIVGRFIVWRFGNEWEIRMLLWLQSAEKLEIIRFHEINKHQTNDIAAQRQGRRLCKYRTTGSATHAPPIHEKQLVVQARTAMKSIFLIWLQHPPEFWEISNLSYTPLPCIPHRT